MKRKPVAPRPQALDVDAIRARMKARREALGLSQWDITRAIGHSTNAWVSSFESGRRGRRVTMDMLARVAQVLRMTTEELTGEQPMPTRTVELDDEHSQVIGAVLAERSWSPAARAALDSWVRRGGAPTVDQVRSFLRYIEASEQSAEMAALSGRALRDEQ